MKYCALTIILFVLVALTSCKNRFEREAESVVKEWTGKTIVNIPDSNYIVYNGKTVDTCSLVKSELMIVSYINRSEATSCMLHLHDWEKFISYIDSLTNKQVKCALIANPENKYEFIDILEKYGFKHPIYIDEKDVFNKANHFPSKMSFHTFLVDNKNKVIFIGNPINSSGVRESYIKIITGKRVEFTKSKVETNAVITMPKINLGHLKYGTKKKASFDINNIGKNNLILQDVKTSCGCITVSYNQAPIRPKGTGKVEVLYHATSEGVFNKTIRIFCNTPDSPLLLNITGEVDKPNV